jgi:hypothetical protein
VGGERQQNDKRSDADSRSFCDDRFCPTFDVRKYMQQLRQMLPYVPPIDLTALKRLHGARDHKGIIRLVKRLMNIEAVTFQVFWVPDGAANNVPKDAPAWVELPREMPLYGSKEFKEMTIKMFFRKSFFQQAYDQATFAVAHELSHVVLESIRHPLRKCEKAVDMTAMLLGFGQLYEMTCHQERQVGNQINIRTLGYLTREEARQANQVLAREHKHGRASQAGCGAAPIAAPVFERPPGAPLRAAPRPSLAWIWELFDRVRGYFGRIRYPRFHVHRAAAYLKRNWYPHLRMQEEQQGVAVLLGLCAALLALMMFAKWITERPPGSANASISLQPAQPTAGTVYHEKESAVFSAPPSSQITQIQTRLIQLGYLGGRADGVWGPRSQSALRSFKSANGLPVNDLWTEETSSILFSPNAAYAPAPVVGRK